MKDIILEASKLKKYFPISRIAGLKKETAYIKAVDQIDLVIRKGETVAIVGESGSGKTTLSRLLLMLETPDEGELRFKGEDVSRFSQVQKKAFKKSIQPVFQNPMAALNPRMKVGEIIAEPLKFLSDCDKNEYIKKVLQVLTKVGLREEDAEKYPHQFSGGQRQRIAIARALISEPELIILDEPVASQDISIQAQILNLLKDLQETDNISFVFIAHDLATVKFLSDRVYVMYFGKVVEQATTEELFAGPKHPYTQNLLASHLPSHPDDRNLSLGKEIVDGEVPSPLDNVIGCNFQSRCPHKKNVCEKAQQLLVIETVNEGQNKQLLLPNHQVACSRYSEI